MRTLQGHNMFQRYNIGQQIAHSSFETITKKTNEFNAQKSMLGTKEKMSSLTLHKGDSHKINTPLALLSDQLIGFGMCAG